MKGSQIKKQEHEAEAIEFESNIDEDETPDALYVAGRLKLFVKRTDTVRSSPLEKIASVITIPLEIIRNYTIPMADFADWDRNRAAILPLCIPTCFLFFHEYFSE
jgi:hypothetical protein